MSTRYNLYSTDGDLLAEQISADEFIICGHGRYFNYDGQTYYQQGFVPWGDSEVNLYGFAVPQTPLEVDQAIIDRGEACPRCGGAWYATDDVRPFLRMCSLFAMRVVRKIWAKTRALFRSASDRAMQYAAGIG